MSLLPRHLLLTEQFSAWKERNIHVPRRARNMAERNAALSTPDIKDYLKGHFCTKPFDTMETTDEGVVHMCCPDWLPTPIGGIDDLPKAWRSKAAEKIRSSIVDGSFEYCSHIDCALISSRTLIDRDSEVARALAARHVATRTAPPPAELILSHDRSCNLSCPSCRTKTIVAGKAKQQKLDTQVELSFLPTLKQVKRVYITGSGDPFGSAHFRRLIKRLSRDEFPHLAFHLHTNGQLWDRRAWADLDLSRRVGQAHVSIDAATSDTYDIVRRGGSFERLLRNLAFIKTLRAAGEFEEFVISMVVQKTNFREMPAFARLGKEFGADSIEFQMIRNWGTLPNFDTHHIGRNHPDFDDLGAILNHPDLHQPGVDIGNIVANRNVALERATLDKAG